MHALFCIVFLFCWRFFRHQRLYARLDVLVLKAKQSLPGVSDDISHRRVLDRINRERLLSGADLFALDRNRQGIHSEVVDIFVTLANPVTQIGFCLLLRFGSSPFVGLGFDALNQCELPLCDVATSKIFRQETVDVGCDIELGIIPKLVEPTIDYISSRRGRVWRILAACDGIKIARLPLFF